MLAHSCVCVHVGVSCHTSFQSACCRLEQLERDGEESTVKRELQKEWSFVILYKIIIIILII